MEYDNELYVPQSNTPSARPHPYSTTNEGCSFGSGNEQILNLRQSTEAVKVKLEDTSRLAARRRRLNVSSAQAAIAVDQRQKKRSAQRENDKFPGLRPAELLSPRYLEYRKKQQEKQDASGADKLVWPDYLEHAFQLALRAVPPVGRKKKRLGTKLCGRNEEISQRIEEWTGVLRRRKQISSHIQVLRAFMVGNEDWLQHVVANDHSPAPHNFHELDIANLREDQIESYARSHFGLGGQPAYSNGLPIPPPDGILGSNVPARGPYLNRIEFEMFVLGPTHERIHRYTSNQTDIGAPSPALEEIPQWYTSYPRLEHYYNHRQLDSDIILIDCSLSLLGESPPKYSSLSIVFSVNVAAVLPDDKWEIKTDYYEHNGRHVDMQSYDGTRNSRKTSDWHQPDVFQGRGQSDVNLEIPLQSTWWVQLFHGMAVRKQRTRHDPSLMQQEEEASRRYLQEMSIMQELRRTSRSTHSRVAIILWRFSATQTGQTGITTWRKLKAPPARSQINSPVHSPTPPLQHSMNLDSAIQSIAMPQPMSIHAERFLQHSDMFVEGSERNLNEVPSTQGSPSPGISPDYIHSFPSSTTTTSFPPEVTHGNHEGSQGSACYPHEVESFRQNSFASQSSYLHSQMSAHTYEETAANDEDLRRLSQPSALELPDSAYFSQESFEPFSHFQSPGPRNDLHDEEELNRNDHMDAQNFAGGHIQLSFQQQGEAGSSHPAAPYVATVTQLWQTEHGGQPGSQMGDEELHSPPDDLAHMIAGHPPPMDFDFSTLETHFTPEELAAIRAHDFSEYQVQTIECSVQTDAMQHADEAALQENQIECGVVLGEVVDEQMLPEERLDTAENEEFDFEEIHVGDGDDECQTILGQTQGIGIDYQHELGGVGVLEE
ncbi:MAG: hypothetical protein LQ352_003043 [Teloschistes flavicans]|nr:MAG: hypothetical protein LQ352_003043 [Teloschistes flavicans]